MNYCCDSFRSFCLERGLIGEGDSQREVYPNIQIVKLEKDRFDQGNNLYRFLLVCGLQKEKPPVVNMRHCPFCGTNLFDFYQNDKYVNGNSANFF